MCHECREHGRSVGGADLRLAGGQHRPVGFGLDSMIERISGAALLWRLHQDADERHRAAAERIALRVVGTCLILLSLYITVNSLHSLISRRALEPGVQLGHHDFRRGDAFLVHIHGNASTVVHNSNRVVFVNERADLGTVPANASSTELSMTS